MNMSKVGLAAVAAAAVMALAIARTASSDPPATKPSKASAPPKSVALPIATTMEGQVVTPPAPGANPNAPPAVPAGPAGKAEIKELAYDAGSVERGEDITHAFVIKNVGQHDLTVDAKPG